MKSNCFWFDNTTDKELEILNQKKKAEKSP